MIIPFPPQNRTLLPACTTNPSASPCAHSSLLAMVATQLEEARKQLARRWPSFALFSAGRASRQRSLSLRHAGLCGAGQRRLFSVAIFVTVIGATMLSSAAAMMDARIRGTDMQTKDARDLTDRPNAGDAHFELHTAHMGMQPRRALLDTSVSRSP